MSDGKTIVINVGSSSVPSKKIEVKENTKRKEHYKLYMSKFADECKDFACNFGKSLGNLFYIFFYGFTVLGDILLLFSGSQNKKAAKKSDEPKKKNILDEGW